MSAALVRLNKNRRCAKRNEKPISGWLLAAAVTLVLCAAVALDMPRLFALLFA